MRALIGIGRYYFLRFRESAIKAKNSAKLETHSSVKLKRLPVNKKPLVPQTGQLSNFLLQDINLIVTSI